jgi:hypothetical protein
VTRVAYSPKGFVSRARSVTPIQHLNAKRVVRLTLTLASFSQWLPLGNLREGEINSEINKIKMILNFI